MRRYKNKLKNNLWATKKNKSETITKSICANFSHYPTFKLKISALLINEFCIWKLTIHSGRKKKTQKRCRNANFGDARASVLNKNFTTLFKAFSAAAMPNVFCNDNSNHFPPLPFLSFSFTLSLFFFLVNTCACYCVWLPASSHKIQYLWPRLNSNLQKQHIFRFNTLSFPTQSWPSSSKNLIMKKCKKIK